MITAPSATVRGFPVIELANAGSNPESALKLSGRYVKVAIPTSTAEITAEM